MTKKIRIAALPGAYFHHRYVALAQPVDPRLVVGGGEEDEPGVVTPALDLPYLGEAEVARPQALAPFRQGRGEERVDVEHLDLEGVRLGACREFNQLASELHVAEVGHARFGDEKHRRVAADPAAGNVELRGKRTRHLSAGTGSAVTGCGARRAERWAATYESSASRPATRR